MIALSVAIIILGMLSYHAFTLYLTFRTKDKVNPNELIDNTISNLNQRIQTLEDKVSKLNLAKGFTK